MTIHIRPTELRAAADTMRTHITPLDDAATAVNSLALPGHPAAASGVVEFTRSVSASASVLADAAMYLADSAVAAAESFERGDEALAAELDQSTTFGVPR